MAYFVNGNAFFKAARKGHFALGAYNTNNLEWTRAILQAAEDTRTPVLIQVSMGAAKYMGGYKLVKDLVADEMDSMKISVPVILNLDHGDYEAAKECIALGYSSVMFDGHNLPVAENFDKTKEIVRLAHEKGISVEAEIGKMGENQGAFNGELATVRDARAFADIGVDKLAACVGNIHGIYPANWPGLNFQRLRQIAAAIDTPLVLHGGSGIPKDQVCESIRCGISKVNINTEFQQAFQRATRAYIEAGKDLDLTTKGYDPRKLLKPGTEAIVKAMKEMISWLGTPTIDELTAMETDNQDFDREDMPAYAQK